MAVSLTDRAAEQIRNPLRVCVEDMATGACTISGRSGNASDIVLGLLDGIREMPGCLSYIVAKDAAGDDAIWITEVWDSEASHKASLTLPGVRAAITAGRPLIAGFESQAARVPVGGQGLPA